MYVMGDPPDYEPRAETSVAAIAAREGRSPDEVAYDYLTGDAVRARGSVESEVLIAPETTTPYTAPISGLPPPNLCSESGVA